MEVSLDALVRFSLQVIFLSSLLSSSKVTVMGQLGLVPSGLKKPPSISSSFSAIRQFTNIATTIVMKNAIQEPNSLK